MRTESSGHAGRRWKAGVVLLLGLLATCAVSWRLREITLAKDTERFANNVVSTRNAIVGRLETYVSLLHGAVAFFAASDEVSPEEFHAYVNRLRIPTAYPGIQGIGFSRRLAGDELPALTQAMREAGIDDFRVWPQEDRDEYHSILYLEPLDRRNRAAVGYDMFTEPTRRAAMAKARDTGLPAASGKVVLVQEIDEQKQAGFLIYVPVYRGGTIPSEVAERRRQLLGFVYSPFRADDLLAGVFASEEKPRVGFTIYDGQNVAAQSQLHQSGAVADARFTTREVIEVAGRP